MYESFAVGRKRKMYCGDAEWVKRGTLRWFVHVRRINEEGFRKSECESRTVGDCSKDCEWFIFVS